MMYEDCYHMANPHNISAHEVVERDEMMAIVKRTASVKEPETSLAPAVTFDLSMLDQALHEASQAFLSEIKDYTEDLEQHKAIIQAIPIERYYESSELRKETIVVKGLETEKSNALAAYEKSISTRDTLKKEISDIERDDRFIQATIARRTSLMEAETLRDKCLKNNERHVENYNEMLEEYKDNDEFNYLRLRVYIDDKGRERLPFSLRLSARLSNFWEEYRKFTELRNLRDAVRKYRYAEDHFGIDLIKSNYDEFIDTTFPEYKTMIERLLPEVEKNLSHALKLVSKAEKELELAISARTSKYNQLRNKNAFSFSPSFNAINEIMYKLQTLRTGSFECERRYDLLTNNRMFRAICSSQNTFGLEDDAQDTMLLFLNNSAIELSVLFSAICPKYREIESVAGPVIRVTASRKSKAPIRVVI